MLAMKFEGGGIVCLAVCSVSFCSGSLSWSSQLFAPGLPSIYFILASLKSTEVRSPCSLQVVGDIFHPYNLSGRHDLADLGVSFGTVGELGLSPHPLLLIPPTRTRTSSKSSLPATLQPTLLPPPQPPPASPPPRLPISSRTSRPSRILSSCSHHLHLLPMTMSVSTGFSGVSVSRFSPRMLTPGLESQWFQVFRYYLAPGIIPPPHRPRPTIDIRPGGSGVGGRCLRC
jgi:hypothetical protein